MGNEDGTVHNSGHTSVNNLLLGGKINLFVGNYVLEGNNLIAHDTLANSVGEIPKASFKILSGRY